jgi:uncharacterized membrane-anchored protein
VDRGRSDDVAGVRREDTSEDLDERRFPGAVRTCERVDLAAANLEVDLAQRLRARKALRDAGDAEDYFLAAAFRHNEV